MKVHLRQRKQTAKGKISLYLEIYKGAVKTKEGKTKVLRDYEYLDLYLIEKPKTNAEKEKNKEILAIAVTIKAQRVVEIANNQYNLPNSIKKKGNLIQFFEQKAEEKYKDKGSYVNWDNSLKHLVKYAGENVLFKDVTLEFCNGYKDYLLNAKKTNGGKLSNSSISTYLNRFRACLSKAVKEKIISENVMLDIENPKMIESKREYLTLEEVRAVAKEDCKYPVLKNAFLFSVLTGLRWSDIHNMKWNQIRFDDTGVKYVFNHQKTNKLDYMDISKQALNYLPDQGAPFDRVFVGLRYSSYFNVALARWMMKAGITKHITFHCARHTFAVLQLDMGTEIYTLSKLLGHSDLRTTQIYSDILDKKKTDAVNKMPDINI